MTPQITGEIGSARLAPARVRAAADRGLDVRKHPRLAVKEECFYVTSPFIEPDGLIIRSRSSSEAVLEYCALILRSRGFWYESLLGAGAGRVMWSGVTQNLISHWLSSLDCC
jgi:hypothetical protein